MGYHSSIYSIKKEDFKKIKSITKQQLFNNLKKTTDDEFLSKYDVLSYFNATKVVDLGEPFWDSGIKKHLSNFFIDKQLHNYFNEDREFLKISKNGIKEIIEFTEAKIKDSYEKDYKTINELLNFVNEHIENQVSLKDYFKSKKINDSNLIYRLNKLERSLLSMKVEWSDPLSKPYNLYEQEITNSWKFEYFIFELVRIFKTTNFDDNILIYIAG